MAQTGSDTRFVGSIPELYDSLFVPLIFEPYARGMAQRVAGLAPQRVLETAAGTGVLTRAMLQVLPTEVVVIATDLNPPMLARAAQVGTCRPVQWQAADAMQLPFDDQSFDLVVCQFGVMFFPDKPHAFAEARRVLRPGGTLLFTAWDRIEDNEFTDTVTQALARMFPDDPPRFMARVPHGYFDRDQIARDLVAGGFDAVSQIETISLRSRAESAYVPAVAFCQGSPLRSEIEARTGGNVVDATAVCAEAISQQFGSGPVDGKIQAHVVSVTR